MNATHDLKSGTCALKMWSLCAHHPLCTIVVWMFLRVGHFCVCICALYLDVFAFRFLHALQVEIAQPAKKLCFGNYRLPLKKVRFWYVLITKQLQSQMGSYPNITIFRSVWRSGYKASETWYEPSSFAKLVSLNHIGCALVLGWDS